VILVVLHLEKFISQKLDLERPRLFASINEESPLDSNVYLCNFANLVFIVVVIYQGVDGFVLFNIVLLFCDPKKKDYQRI
jgi:hypothetical protein